jgi:hypothetical protein
MTPAIRGRPAKLLPLGEGCLRRSRRRRTQARALRERAEELELTALATPNAVGFQAMEFKDRALPARAQARRSLASSWRLVCWLISVLMAGHTDFWRNGPFRQTSPPRPGKHVFGANR